MGIPAPRFLTALCIALAVAWLGAAGPSKAADVPVDVELVLAADISGSMDEVELALQRQGYLRALTNPRVIGAIQSGQHRRIAIAFVEWAGPHWQNLVADWTLVYDLGSAQAFAAKIGESPVNNESRTSISAAIDFIAPMFAANGYAGKRRVIDISGDGPNNRGRSVLAARAEALALGLTINGLPIINDRPNPWGGPPPADLDIYYQDNVIGGPGAFMIPVTGMKNFAQAILSKLIREIAGTDAPERATEAARLAD
ncbi:MAG: DUF1194 domain-containing protein [Alphaproteobacteria bacterium]|nr:DUF1194 domain-containing protein [Alphaproteobacteria bacterium]